MVKYFRVEISRRRGSSGRRRGASRLFGRHGSSGGRPLHGGACKGIIGTLGRVVPFLGRGCGLLLGLEGVSQGGVARGCAFALQVLSGGSGFVCLLLGEALGDHVALDRGGGAVDVVTFGARRRCGHGAM